MHNRNCHNSTHYLVYRT